MYTSRKPIVAIAAVFASLVLPANTMADAFRHSGIFGGTTYGHFAYEGKEGGTEPGWGFTFGAFGELTPFPSDILTLTIEGSYLLIGSGDDHAFHIPEAEGPSLESRSFLSAAPLFKLAFRGRIHPYLQLGPALNFRLPEGTSYPGAVILGGEYGLGIASLVGHRSYMAEVRYLHHWSSSADGYNPPSRARALLLTGRISF